MFDALGGRLGDVFDRLRKRGALSESDVGTAMRDIRVALLEADVALPVVKEFVDAVRERALGADVMKSVTPGQMVVKIVHDHMVKMLGPEAAEINLTATPPVAIMLVGLQGSGKTTTAAKIALRLKERNKRRVLLASLDIRRPAAQEQLAVLGAQAGVDTLPIVPLQTPRMITDRALETARLEGYDVVILDTAGRLAVDEDTADYYHRRHCQRDTHTRAENCHSRGRTEPEPTVISRHGSAGVACSGNQAVSKIEVRYSKRRIPAIEAAVGVQPDAPVLVDHYLVYEVTGQPVAIAGER